MLNAASRWLPALLTAMVALGPLSTDLYLPALPSIAAALAADQGAAPIDPVDRVAHAGSGPEIDLTGAERHEIGGRTGLLCAHGRPAEKGKNTGERRGPDES